MKEKKEVVTSSSLINVHLPHFTNLLNKLTEGCVVEQSQNVINIIVVNQL